MAKKDREIKVPFTVCVQQSPLRGGMPELSWHTYTLTTGGLTFMSHDEPPISSIYSDLRTLLGMSRCWSVSLSSLSIRTMRRTLWKEPSPHNMGLPGLRDVEIGSERILYGCGTQIRMYGKEPGNTSTI